MNVTTACKRRVPMVAKSANASEVAKTMRALDEWAVIVTDERGGRQTAVGIATLHELGALRADAEGRAPVTLQEVMRSGPAFVADTDDLAETVWWMCANRLEEVVVHDGEGRLVGLAMLEDLIQELARESEAEEETLPPGEFEERLLAVLH